MPGFWVKLVWHMLYHPSSTTLHRGLASGKEENRMTRRLLLFLFLMTSIIGMTPGDSFGGDPPNGIDPDDILGDPDDDFKPKDYSLTNDLSAGDTTSGGSRQKGKVPQGRSNQSLLNFWIRILPGQHDK